MIGTKRVRSEYVQEGSVLQRVLELVKGVTGDLDSTNAGENALEGLGIPGLHLLLNLQPDPGAGLDLQV